MRDMKKATAAILASIMALSSVPQYTVTAEETGQSNATVMEVGETYEVFMDEGEVLYYTFVPKKNGEYVFTSEGDYDVYATLLDGEENEIAEDDDGGEEYNFHLSANLTAGEVYSLEIGSYEDEAEFYISVTQETFSLQYESDITLLYGEEAELVVNVASEEEGSISYQWYNYEEEEEEYIEINGATDAVYNVKSDDINNSYAEYKCLVTAGEQTKTAYFYVKIESGLTLDYQKYQYGFEGDSVTLEVHAKSKLEELTYSWYEDEELIEGESGNSCTITLSEPKEYSCKVSDGITTKWAYFSVEIGQAGEKRVESISLSTEQKKFYFYDLNGKSTYFSGSIKIRYADGTEEWISHSECEDWDTIETDECGDWIAGKYKRYVYYKGAVTSFDIVVIRNSDIVDMQMENESDVQACDEENAYHCYKISVSETGNYGIIFSNIEGIGQVALLDGENYRYNYKLTEDDVLEYSLEAGKDYYLAVTAMDTAELSYKVKFTKDYWQTIALDEVVTVASDSYRYYKYIPEKSGIYRQEELGTYNGGAYREIYNKDMKVIASGNEEMNLQQFYLKQGEIYYFKICNWDEIDRELTLKNVEYIDYPSAIIAAGKYDNMSWTLDDAGVLSINSEDGKMPAAPWGCLNTEVKSVEFGDDLTEIAEGAFMGCVSLTEIQIPEKIEKIGLSAFENCSMLSEIELPSNLTEIEKFIFYECSNLKKIELPEKITKIGKYAFYNCSKLEKLEIPSSVTEIEEEAFCWCENLKEVIQQDKNNLHYVGKGAFSATQWLKEQGNTVMLGDILLKYHVEETDVVIPQGVSYIGEAALGYLPMKTVTISNSVKEIWNYGFERCVGLEQIKVPGTVTDIAYRAFDNCTALESVVLEEGVQLLGEAAFLGCNTLKTVTVPKSVTEIGINAIGYEWDWEQWKPKKADNLPTIHCYADSAAYTYAIENEIPYVLLEEGEDITKPSDNPSQSEKPSDNTGSTGGETPSDNTNIPQTNKPSDTTNTPQPEKPSDSSTEQITTPDTVKTVQLGACEYEVTSAGTVTLTGLKKSKTKKLTIPKTITVNGTKYKVTAIADKAFKNTKITNLIVGSNIKAIGTSAFEGCKSLTKVTIGSDVTKLGKNAFKNCKKLKTITIKSAKLKTVGKNAFKGIKSTAKIKVPKKKLNSYKKMLKKAGIGKKVQIVK